MDSGSRNATAKPEIPYARSEEWGQPPASQQIIEVRVRRGVDAKTQSDSMYVATGPAEAHVDAELEAEFAAWDIASDEAFLDCEAELA
ncbi:MAG: hypothetical protein R6X31_08545 [Anaerolineae bacterium]